MKVQKQTDMLPKYQNAYGGELRNTRKGRSGPRALSTKDTMHLVLRSSLAQGPWSFRRNDGKIKATVKKFTHKYGVKLISLANAGNHLHMQIQITNRHTYRAFITALTSTLALVVTGASFKCSMKDRAKDLGIAVGNIQKKILRFWDYRPFTRIVRGYKALLNLKDYIEINRLEVRGYDRNQARFLIEFNRNAPEDPFPGSA
jgi:putative transposase